MRASYAIAALASLALGACADPPAEPRPAGDCGRYASSPDVYAYCVRRQAARVFDPAQVKAICAQLAPPFAGECRTAWVEERLHSTNPPAFDVFMDVCGDVADCSFNVIDNYPSMDVSVQMQRCRERTGGFTNDCVGHALQRWIQRDPSEEELQRIIVEARDFPQMLGNWVGAYRWCHGERVPTGASFGDAVRVRCPAEPRAAKACVDAMISADHLPIQCSLPAAVPPPPMGGPPSPSPAGPPPRR